MFHVGGEISTGFSGYNNNNSNNTNRVHNILSTLHCCAKEEELGS
jgi:hypothetical protein